MEDNLKIIKVEYLSNCLLDPTTILGLGLPVDSHLLQGNPSRLLGDGDDGAGGDLHCSVELPAGKLTSGRESI